MRGVRGGSVLTVATLERRRPCKGSTEISAGDADRVASELVLLLCERPRGDSRLQVASPGIGPVAREALEGNRGCGQGFPEARGAGARFHRGAQAADCAAGAPGLGAQSL